MATFKVTFYGSVEIEADTIEEAAQKYDEMSLLDPNGDAEYIDLNSVINCDTHEDVTADFAMC